MVRRFGMKIAFLLCLFQPLAAFGQESGQSKEEVLRRLRHSLSRFSSLNLRATVDLRFPIDQGERGLATLHLRVKRLGSNALVSAKELVDRPGQPTWRLQKDFVVYENGDVLDCQAEIDASLQQLEGRSRLGFALHSQRLAGFQAVDRRSVYFALNDAAGAVWVIGYLPLLEYLDNESGIQIAPRDGAVEIRAAGDHGRLTLTVSPASGWLPQSFELIKEPEHKTIGGRVADVFENAVTSVVWTGKATGISGDSEGRWAPAEMQVQRRTNWKAKPAETIDTMIKFEEVAFDPPLTAADFQSDIVAPAGYPVDIKGAEHLPYLWDGHAAVPGIPEKPPRLNPVEYLDLDSAGSGFRTQTILILFNLFLALIFAALFWRKKGRFR